MKGEIEQLRGMDQGRYLADQARMQQYITTMFTVIAPRYDRFTRAFSFGMDRRWKQLLVELASRRLPPGALVADLACGTGDLARALQARLPGSRCHGLDAALAMLQQAAGLRLPAGSPAGTPAPPPPAMLQGDLMHLPYAAGSLDGLLIGYGVRNVPDPRACLQECARVLAPGGVIALLEFTRPRQRLWRGLFLGYLAIMGSLYGWWWHGHADVYRYISRSIARFLTRAELVQALEAAGCSLEEEHSFLGGGIAVLMLRRRQDAPAR